MKNVTPCAEWEKKLSSTHPEDLSPSERFIVHGAGQVRIAGRACYDLSSFLTLRHDRIDALVEPDTTRHFYVQVAEDDFANARLGEMTWRLPRHPEPR